jgi:two-component system, NtrC family, response regulator AtoC
MRALMNYDFPGNIRELRNLIERACILSTGEEITAENFPVPASVSASSDAAPRTPTALNPGHLAELIPETSDLREFLAAVETAIIQRSLKMTGGAQAEVARRLGLSRSHLSYKLAKHRIKSVTR